jgi:hypothetical protein
VQPVLTQVPPNNFRSTMTVFRPAFANRTASAGPDCPVPITIASNLSGMGTSPLHGRAGAHRRAQARLQKKRTDQYLDLPRHDGSSADRELRGPLFFSPVERLSGILCCEPYFIKKEKSMASGTGIKAELLDELLKGQDPKTLFEPDGLLDELKKAFAERALNAEMDHHLEQDAEQAAGNHRNGSSSKTVLTENGKLALSIPRDRQSRFEPQLIAKYQRRFPGFDEKIIALYARGMSTRDIQAHLRELYGTEISPELVSAVTDAVLDEVSQWQNRPLEPVYAIVFFDCLRVKIRDEGTVKNKAVYLAIGVRCSGHREVLGIWIEQTEGAKFWLRVMTEIRNRGTHDVLIAVVDGLKGFPEAISAVFPSAQVQTCIVHLIRYSMQKVSGYRPELAAQLGASDSVLRVSRGRAPYHLHDECHRELAQSGQKVRSRARPLPQR